MINHIFSYVFSIPFANFLCVVGVGTYLTKTRLIPFIDTAMKEKEEAKQALKQLVQTTRQQRETVQESSQEQQLYAQELLEKLKTWNSAIEVTQEQEAKSRLKGMRAITALIKKQEASLVTMYSLKALTPVVIDNATSDLVKIFSVKSKQQDFLNAAIKDLEQEMV